MQGEVPIPLARRGGQKTGLPAFKRAHDHFSSLKSNGSKSAEGREELVGGGRGRK